MVFKRNTLRNTRKFKQSTSINSSNVKITQSKPVSYKKPTVKTIIQPTSVSQGRQNYNTGYTSDWRLKDLFPTTPIVTLQFSETILISPDGSFRVTIPDSFAITLA